MSTGPAACTCAGCRRARPGSSPAWAGRRTRSRWPSSSAGSPPAWWSRSAACGRPSSPRSSSRPICCSTAPTASWPAGAAAPRSPASTSTGVGHYLGEAALLTGLGFRAQGHLTVSGSYVTAGLAAALLAMLVKAETDNVVVARAESGLAASHADAALAPRSSGLALARRLAAALKLHRIIHAVELSLLILDRRDHRHHHRHPDRHPRAPARVPGHRRPSGRRAPPRGRRFKAAQVIRRRTGYHLAVPR